MMKQPLWRGARERGVVLIAALLLLVVMSILAMTMFRTNGVQELIAGNVREKQRAVQTAMDAETYAEMVLSIMGNIMDYQDPTNNQYTTCTGVVAYSATLPPKFCWNTLASVGVTNPTTVPWINTTSSPNGEIGFTFYPGNIVAGTDDLTISATPGTNSYLQVPRLYIAYLGQVANQAYFQVDAWNWASTQNTAAEVEGIYVVICHTSCPAATL